MELRRADDHPVLPWKNGRGTTREIIAFPSREAWDWRVSAADVRGDDEFSRFPGIDRQLAVIEGGRLDLTVDGVPAHLHERFGVLAFDGGVRTRARLLDGPLRDLNLMTRRDVCCGLLELTRVAPGGMTGVIGGDATARAQILVEGSAYLGDVRLEPLDAVLPSGDPVDVVAGVAGCVVATVWIAPPNHPEAPAPRGGATSYTPPPGDPFSY